MSDSTSESLVMAGSGSSSYTEESKNHEKRARDDLEDPYRDAEANCGLKRYKPLGICVVALFFIFGFGIIIAVTVKHGSGSSNDQVVLQQMNLNTMYNRSIAPQLASIAWLNEPNADQFINVVNGSFYITTLPDYQNPVLTIAASDLNQYASLTPSLTTTTTKKSSRRHLLSTFDEGNPDIDTLHSSAGSSSGGVPSTPRSLRPRPNHMNTRVMHSQQHNQQLHGSHPIHTQSSSAPLSSPSKASVSDSTATFNYVNYDLSPDQEHMLFSVNCTQLYRHSSFCTYLIYDIGTKQMTHLAQDQPLRLVVWSPKSDLLAYVLDNNIYLYNLTSATTKTITTDGAWDRVINGVMDWVYEEEEFEATSALWWSPDGSSFAFLHFNETLVPKYGFDFYTQPYNVPFSYKYPKAGFPNSMVDIYTYDIAAGVVHTFAGVRTTQDYEYIMNVLWFSPTELMIRVENRAQNQWQLLKLSIVGGVETVTKLSAATAAYYFESHNSLTSLYPLPYYIDLVNDSSDSIQLALYSITDGSLVRFLTGGLYVPHTTSPSVLNINGIKLAGVNDTQIFYTREILQTAAVIAVPTLWQVSLGTVTNGTDAIQLVPYANCGFLGCGRYMWQSGSFSPTGSYFLLQELAVVPQSTLYAVNASAPIGGATIVTVLADNTAIVNSLTSSYAVPTTTYFQIPSALPGLVLSASVMLPAGASLDDCTPRPVLMYAYSGPGSQQVTTTYPFTYGSTQLFHASLVSTHGYVVVIVDTVGTSGKGEKYRKSHTYLRLGLQERADILAATQWIGQQCWADSNKISYWGWSYGGFLSSFTAAAGSGLFSSIISVAPVTSWTLYDTIYTERYMLQPVDNPGGYANTSVIQAASTSFDSSNWHLFGGTADDNVHFQNSALLVDALIQLDMPASVFYFPNRAHSLTQWHTGQPPRYLYERLTQILTGQNGPNGNGGN